MDKVRKSMLVKFYVVVVLVLVLFLLIFYRVMDIQYVQGEYYRGLAEKTLVSNVKVPASRGNVYADDGSLLATSMTKYEIHMDVMSVKDDVFEGEVDGLSDSLSRLLGNTSLYYQNKLRRARNSENRYLLLAKSVDYIQHSRMKTFPIFKHGVYGGGFIADQDTVRVYPIGLIAQRTIGYDDSRGRVGIEGVFSDRLIGFDGSRLKQKIAKNKWKPINNSNEVEPVDGRDVVTTIDVNMQDLTHHALLKQLKNFDADHGCAVVMEVETGEVKAISNLGRGKDGVYYEKRNYAIWEKHDPGSTFKLATVMAGLEDKVIDTSSVVDCGKSGVYYVKRRKVVDSYSNGVITMARAFEVSSNIAMVKMVQKHYKKNPKKFTDRLSFFGLGKKTGVCIKGEGEPYLPDPKTNRWSPISLEWMAWGYGSLMTPLQMLTFYNGVANGGELVKPRLVKKLVFGSEIEKSFDKIVLNPKIATKSTIAKVTAMMEGVVRRGTAKKLFSSDFSMAGKTGTAQKYIPRHIGDDGRVVAGHYSRGKYIASFAGFFPVKRPKYSCIVVIHEPKKEKGYTGAVVAGPVFKEIARRIYMSTPVKESVVGEYITSVKVQKEYDRYLKKLQKYKTIMPNVVSMAAMDAIVLLENMGLKVSYDGVGEVIGQSIKKGVKIRVGDQVVLKCQ